MTAARFITPSQTPRWYPPLKRLGDVLAAALLLILSAPLMGMVALWIRLESPGPAFFTQTRSGRDGLPFTLYKFRTLRQAAHDPARPQALVTPLGAVLRRWGLDEWPQLWNVLRGEMSLVGPRPTLPEQVAHYGPFERQRLAVRPGLTGWAQIHGRNSLDWPARIRLDVWYAHHYHLGLDLRILWRTPMALRTDTAYGQDGQNPDFTASDSLPTAPMHAANAEAEVASPTAVLPSAS